MQGNNKYLGVLATFTIFIVSVLISVIFKLNIIYNEFGWEINFLVVFLLLILLYYVIKKVNDNRKLSLGLFIIIAFIYQNAFLSYLVNLLNSSDNDPENDFVSGLLGIPFTLIAMICLGLYYDKLRIRKPFKVYILIVVIIMLLWYVFSYYVESMGREKVIGENAINGLDNNKIEFYQGERFMGTSDIRYNLKYKSNVIMEDQFLFHTSDDLEIEDLYVNSYDSIIYVSFSKNKDDVLYFVDLKTNVTENTELSIKKDSVSEDKYKSYQDSLYNVKDSIFRVLYKHNNKLKMTGYNK